MYVQELKVKVSAEISRLQEALKTAQDELGQMGEAATAAGEAVDKMAVTAERAAKKASSAQAAYRKELEATFAKIEELTGRDELALSRLKFGGFVNEDDLALLKMAKDEVKQVAQTRITGEQQARREAQQTAKEATQAAKQREAEITRQNNLREAGLNAYRRELAATQAKIAEMNGTDKLAGLRQQFGGFASEVELTQLAEAREQVMQLNALRIEGEKAVRAAQREAEAERKRAAKEIADAERASEREAAQAARAALAEQEALIKKRIALQERFNTELAKTAREYQLTAMNPVQKLFYRDNMPDLRLAHPGIGDEDLSKMATLQTRMRGIEAGRDLAGSAGTGVANASAGILAVGLATAKMATDVEHGFVIVRNNTTMTDREFAHMKQTVLDLAKDTGSSIDKLSEGFMHVTNFGYQGADAVNILSEANKAARATGGDVATTAQLLAKVMKENGIETSKAAETMNMLWYAAANSDAKMEQFVETGGRVFAMAARMGLGFKETAASMSVFMGMGLNAAATTQLQGVLNKIIQPSGQVRKEIEKLSQKTGVDLVRDFSIAGLQSRQLSGVFEDVRRVALLTHQPFERLATDLFPNLRGTIGALIGTSDSGVEGLTRRLKDMADIQNGNSPLNARFAQEQATTQAEIDRLANTLKVEFLPVGKEFANLLKEAVPFVKDFAGAVKWLMERFEGLPKPLQEVLIGLGALRLATIALGNPFPALFGLLGKLIDLWKGVEVAATAATVAETTAAGGAGAGAAAGGTGLAARFAGGVSRVAALANPITLSAAMLLGSQEGAGQGGDLTAQQRGHQDAERQLSGFTQELKYAQEQLKAWQAMTSEQRLLLVREKFGTSFMGMNNMDRDDYDKSLKANVETAQMHLHNARVRAINQPAAHPDVTFRNPSDLARVNQTLISDLQSVAQSLHMAVHVGTAISGHNTNVAGTNRRSRHMDGNAFDITSINGHPANANDPIGAALADKFVAELEKHGFFRNNEVGHQRGVFWRTMVGGNHFNHIHVSDTGHSPLPGGFGMDGEGGGGSGGSGAPSSWYDQMRYDLTHPKKKVKLSEGQREQNAYNQELAQSQAKLNELMNGGDRAAETLASKYRLLSSAQRDKLQGVKEAISAREKERDAEKRFKDELNQTNAAIRETRNNEDEGLAKLKQTYPGVATARLQYLLNQKAGLEATKEADKTEAKLNETLAASKATLANSSQTHGLHKLAVELTGKAYDALTLKAQGLVNGIKAVRDQVDAQTALSKIQARYDQAVEKGQTMQLPKSARDLIEFAGGPEQWKKLTAVQQMYAAALYGTGKQMEKQGEDAQKAETALERLRAELSAGRDANKALAMGDGEDAAWETRLQQNEGLRQAMAKGGEAAEKARQEFHEWYVEHDNAEKLHRAAEALKSFNAEMEQSSLGIQDHLRGGAGATGAFHDLLGRNRDLANSLSNDPTAYDEAFAHFKQNFDLSKQVEQMERFRQAMAETKREMAMATAGSEFDRFKASQSSVDKDGNLEQVFSTQQLKQMFDAQQKLSEVKQFADGLHGIIQRMFTNLANGGRNFFGNLVSGFQKMFTDIAVNYLSSQFFNVVMKGLGGLFGLGAGGGGGISGTPLGAPTLSGLSTIPGIAGGVNLAGAFANGGEMENGKNYLVGENGPEIVQAHGNGTVYPNGTGPGSGGDTHITNVTMHVHGVQDHQSFQRNESQIYGSLTRNLRLEQARNSS